MNDNERKAWKEVTGKATYTAKYNLTFDTTTFEGASLLKDIAHAKAILAADAELKRLREAIEWACDSSPMNQNDVHPLGCPGWTYTDELRRRAKEG